MYKVDEREIIQNNIKGITDSKDVGVFLFLCCQPCHQGDGIKNDI